MIRKIDAVDGSILSPFLPMVTLTTVSEFRGFVDGFPPWPPEFTPQMGFFFLEA
jgi:hypothetical protein